MRPCPQCGTPCQDAAWNCPACGFNLGGNLKQTLVATPATSPLAPLAPQASTSPLGVASTVVATSPAAAPPAETPPPPAQKFRGTMLGMGVSVPVAPPAAAPAPVGPPQGIPTQTLIGGSPPQGPGAPSVPPAGPAGLKGTMIGLAPVIPSPPPPPPEVPGGATLPLARNAAPSPRKTILGVARPGIAPLHPGMAKAEPVAPGPIPEPPPVWHGAPPTGPGWGDPTSETPALVTRKRRVPWIAVVVILGAAVLASAGVMTILLYRARGSVETHLTADASGRDRLALTCPGCVEGAKVTLGSATGTFKAGKATLTLERPLPVGDHRLELSIERAPGRADQVAVTVPVDFRVRPDTTKLSETPPRVEARVTARAGSAVVVDGRPLALGPDGSASLPIDVSKELTGAEAGMKTLERRIAYAVTPPGGAPHTGEMLVRIGIAPLVVQAPGPSIVIDGPGFVLAGRTAKNAVVTVEGRPITVDPTGSFAQMMSVSSNGETTVVVRASVPDLAPRLSTLKVKRVASLSEEANLARTRNTTSYVALSVDPDGQRGLSVALDGSVVEARSDSFTTILVMDVKSGCKAPPCLARVTWGAKAVLASGDPISVFGSLQGSVEGPRSGTRIPAVAADFVLKGRP
jgi:hypothetical protein